MGVFAPALGQIWISVEDSGMDAEALFREVGIDPNLRFDVSARVSNRQFDELLYLANEKSRDDAFMFTLAKHTQPSFLGALGLAWITSPSLRTAFERFHRYGRAFSDAQEIRVEDEGEGMRVIIHEGSLTFRDRNLRSGLTLACAVQMCRMTHGDLFSPIAVCFQFPEPANISEYYKFFRCELFFDSDFNSLLISADLADQPQPGFNPQLLQQLDLMVIKYLAGLDKNDIVGRVRAEITQQLPSGGVTLTTVSKALNISQRSLIRKLSEKNESFKNLLLTTRKELSEKYVLDKNLSLTEVSFLLGFSETSSFSRAYKKWTGQTPSSHREAVGPQSQE